MFVRVAVLFTDPESAQQAIEALSGDGLDDRHVGIAIPVSGYKPVLTTTRLEARGALSSIANAPVGSLGGALENRLAMPRLLADQYADSVRLGKVLVTVQGLPDDRALHNRLRELGAEDIASVELTGYPVGDPWEIDQDNVPAPGTATTGTPHIVSPSGVPSTGNSPLGTPGTARLPLGWHKLP
jgi:hypothetical protein